MLEESSDRENMDGLEISLARQMEENQSMKSEMDRLKQELVEKDKKIKELNIRLEATRRMNKSS